MNFETYIEARAGALPMEYLRVLTQRHNENYGRDDIVKDIMVEVEYDSGTYYPGSFEHGIPPEAEDPDVTKVTLLEEGFSMEWEDPQLSDEGWRALLKACWEHQERVGD